MRQSLLDFGLGLSRGGGNGIALFLLVGQSNMVGRATYDSGAAHPGVVVQWNQSGAEAATSIPLDHVDPVAGDMGLDINFAISYIAANPRTTKLVFIPCARGATGFADNQWNKGDDSYNAAVSRANAAIANYGVNLSGILWHQGEKDANSTFAQTEAQYAANLDQMIADMRADITGASNVPFVVGEIGAQFLNGGVYPTAAQINAALGDTPNRVVYSACVETGDLTDEGDSVHFDAASLRTMGARYYSAWVTARNLQAPTISGVPTISGTPSVGETLTAVPASVTGSPTITRTWQWERSGTPISGATSSTYLVVEADGGATLTVVQTETNTAGFDSAESLPTAEVGSNPVAAIEAAVTASTSTAFWAPTDSASLLYQDSAKSTAVTTDADPVGALTSTVSDVDVLQATSGDRPLWDETNKLLTFDGSSDFLTASLSSRSSDMYFACVVNTTDNRFSFICNSGSTAEYAGQANSGDTVGAIDVAAGTPTYKVDGVTLSPANRATLHSALADGSDHILEIVGLDLTKSTWAGLQLHKNATGTVMLLNGKCGDYILCDTPSSGDQDSIRAELASRHGITL